MAVPIQVVFDCSDPAGLARFWAAALGYEVQPPPPGYDDWDDFLAAQGVPEERRNDASAVVDPEGRGPRIYFQRVPEGKAVKNRVHLDLNVGGGRGTPEDDRRRRVDAEARRLAGLGASVLFEGRTGAFGEYWTVMADPEGNEFCLQ